MSLINTCVRILVLGVAIGLSPVVMANDPPPDGGPSSQPCLVQFSFVGLPAERLLAAGLTPAQILAAAERLGDAAGQIDALDATLAQLAAAQAQVRALRAQAASGDPEAVAQDLAAALAAAQNLEAQAAAFRAALGAIVLADATPEQRTLAARAVSGAKVGLDAALALAAASDTEHRRLAMALQAESRSQRTGEVLDPDYQETLASARSLPSVTAAAERLVTLWPALRQTLAAPAEGGNP
jgi:hypothetical protein